MKLKITSRNPQNHTPSFKYYRIFITTPWITSSGWWWAYGGSSDRWGMVGELMAHKLRVFEHNMDVWAVSISCNYVSDRGILLIYSPHPSSWSLFQDERIRCSFGAPVFNVKFAFLDHFTTIFNVILLSKWCNGIRILFLN